jgi:hypothetical protein
LKNTLLSALFILTYLSLSPLSATPITYTITALASGTVGGTPFTNQLISLTQTTDTTLVTLFSPGIFVSPATTTSLSVPGFGTGSFTNAGRFFVNQNNGPGVGYNDSVKNDLLDDINPVYGGYDLKSAIGPVFGTSVLVTGGFTSVPTSLGLVTVNSVNSAGGSFTATTTPEPGTWASLAISMAALASISSRRRIGVPRTESQKRS